MKIKFFLSLALVSLTLQTARSDDADTKKALEFLQKLGGGGGTINRHGIQQPWIDTVGLGNTKITDEGLKELHPLKGLADLHLLQTGITDAGLKNLAPLKNLQYLGLQDTKVTDAGMKELVVYEKLLELYLDNTNITDEGVKEIRKIKSIHKLELTGTKITDEGLKELAAMEHLENLYLMGTKITGKGLKNLAPLKTLKNLRLLPAQIDDDALRSLRESNQLHLIEELTFPRRSMSAKVIRLDGAAITDAGIKELADFKEVKTIIITNTKITEKGVEEIKKMWPKVKVVEGKY